MNKVLGQIHDALSRVLNKNDMDMESATFDDLIETVTKNQCLWSEYQAEVRKNDIVTNLACKEYLFVFIEANREHIEKQYFLSKSVKKNFTVSKLTKNKSNYFNNACNTFLRSCKDEITHADKSPNFVLSKSMPENSTRRIRSSTVKKEKCCMVDSQVRSMKDITNKRL